MILVNAKQLVHQNGTKVIALFVFVMLPIVISLMILIEQNPIS